MRAYLNDYVFVLGSAWRRLPVIFGLMVLSALIDLLGLGLIIPLIGALMGSSVPARGFGAFSSWLAAHVGTSSATFAAIAAAVFGAFVAKAIVAFRMQHAVVAFSETHRRDLMVRLMRAYLSLPHEFHLQRNSATLVNVIVQGTSYYSNGTLTSSLRLLADAVMLLAIFALLSATDPKAVALLAALCGGVFLIYNGLFRRRALEAGKRALAAGGDVVCAVNQGVGSYKESRLLQVEDYFWGVVGRTGGRLAQAAADMGAISLVPRYLVECSIVLFLMLYGAGSLALGIPSQEIVPVLALFAAAGLRIMPAFSSFLGSLHGLRFSRSSLRVIAEDLRGTPQIDASPRPRPAADRDSVFRCLELRDVTYTYPGACRPSLSGLSLRIEKGEAIGIIGKSGAGKSTLADVILGLISPQSGSVLLDGVPLSQRRDDWFARVAYIPQTIFLLDDSLRRNIALGLTDAQIDDERLHRAVESSQLSEVVSALPDRLGTVVGERGAKLSGGQRQRVALARALYHDRDVIVMDEATSALDLDTEREVVEAIRALKGSKTLVIIAHRTSLLRDCDWIVEVEDGRAVSRRRPGAIDEDPCVGAQVAVPGVT